METKSKVTQRSLRHAHNELPNGNGGRQPLADQLTDESDFSDQVVEEVPGTTDEAMPAESGTELTLADGHRPVISPAIRPGRKREFAESAAEADPVVEASLANINSSQDEQEFWGTFASAIAPLLVKTVKQTGTTVVKAGIKKLSPTLANMLKQEGFSESAIRQLESMQQESGIDQSAVLGREFWQKLANACMPVLRKRPGMYPGLYPGSYMQKGIANKQSDGNQNEAGTGEREFWGAIASAVVPALMPVAKKAVGVAIKSGTSIVKSGMKKIFESSEQESDGGTEAGVQHLEELFLGHLDLNQQESQSDTAQGEREFFGSLAKKLVPALMPIAQNLAGTAIKTATSAVKGGIKKLSPTLSNMLKQEGFSEAAIQQLEANKKPGGATQAVGDREFWGAIASALVPVLTPVATKVAGMAIKSGTSMVKSGIKKIFESSEQEAGTATNAISEQVEAMFLEELENGQQEFGSDTGQGEREFFGALAKKLVPVLMPVAKSVAGSAVKAGTSWVKKVFESSEQEFDGSDEVTSQLEAMFLEQYEANQQESATETASAQREFISAFAKKIVPIFNPIAKSLSGIVQTGAKKFSPILMNMMRQEGISESAIRQLQASQEKAGAQASTGEREFWGAIASALVPVLTPVAKQVAGAAIKSGTALVKGGIKKIFESQQESGTNAQSAARQLETLFMQELESSEQETGAGSASGEREFFGALAKKLVPVLMPVAQSLAGTAAKAGTAIVKKVSPKLANILRTEGFSESAIQQLESGHAESGMGEREFWGSIASAIVPALAPVAKKLAGAAVKSGTSFVKSGIKKIFESSEQEDDYEVEMLVQELESHFLEETETIQQESSNGVESTENEREFWGSLASALVPVLKPIAGAAVKKGTSFVKGSIKKMFESSEQEDGEESASSDREFWGSLAKVLVPVLKPVAKNAAGAAIKAGTSFVSGGIKKIFESSEQEAGDLAVAEATAILQQFEAMEVIIDTDERIQITNTTDVPFRRICHLSIKAADGTSYLGTGFFIGPRTIITAGHCVYIHEHGGWPQQIIVSPGRNLANRPYGQIVATSFASVKGWVDNQSRNHDYGVIHLAKTDKVSPAIGSFGFGKFSDDSIMAKELSTAGYPGDKPSGTMMFNSRRATAVDANTIVYEIDTVGGQSGSPVYDENNVVVGIHTNGASSGNSATRINQSVFNNLNKWRLQGGAI
ncbi:serine protease [Segetibacter sp. 3557_3]|uniref:trypsin-like serine peptidase n=1 Tax=Segetibacter sp. 3557_3 TaxID=2547429 RepID=UPI00105874F2|nr:serine protease [Segetibacter sp. 3557_3]TDH19954.1 serine protease [Segetibacter sp. 3557_3]